MRARSSASSWSTRSCCSAGARCLAGRTVEQPVRGPHSRAENGPLCGGGGPVGRSGTSRAGERPRARPASVVVPFRADPGDRLELGRLVPSGRLLLVSFAVARRHASRDARRAGDRALRRRLDRGDGCGPSGSRGQVRAGAARREGASLVGLDLEAARSDVIGLSTVAGCPSTVPIRTPCASVVVPERAGCSHPAGARVVVVSRARTGDRAGRSGGERGSRASGYAKRRPSSRAFSRRRGPDRGRGGDAARRHPTSPSGGRR